MVNWNTFEADTAKMTLSERIDYLLKIYKDEKEPYIVRKVAKIKAMLLMGS